MVESSHVDSSHPVIVDAPVIVTSNGGRSDGAEDPRRAVRTMIRRWRLLLAALIIGALLGWLSAVVAADRNPAPVAVDHYQASHVLVMDANVPDTQSVLTIRNLNALAQRITAGDLPLAVAEVADLSVARAADQVRVVVRPDSDSLEIIAIGRTRDEAETLADAYAEGLTIQLEAEAEDFAVEAIASAQLRLTEAEASLRSTRDELEDARVANDEARIILLEQDEQQFAAAREFANATLLDVRADGVPSVPLESLQQAEGRSVVIGNGRFDELVRRTRAGQSVQILFGDEVEEDESGGALAAVSSRLPDGAVPRVGFGAVLGFLAGLMIATSLNRFDIRIRSKRQVEELLDLPVLAEIPAVGRVGPGVDEIVSRDRPKSRFAEQYRGLASSILFAGRTRNSGPHTAQVVLVTSPGPSEGKTTTVANLGVMLAEAGVTVLLVNGDFRRPRLHDHVGVDDGAVDIQPTGLDGVDVLTRATSSDDAPPTEVIAAQRAAIISSRSDYDLIVIDTAPLLATNDAVDLLDLVDDVVLVVRAGKSTSLAADRAAELLERRRAHVLGVGITGIDVNTAEGYYYYGSYYRDESRGPRGPLRRTLGKAAFRRLRGQNGSGRATGEEKPLVAAHTRWDRTAGSED